MLLTKTGIRGAGALGMLLVAAGAANAGALAPQEKAKADSSRMTTNQGQRLLAARSARFIENKGQWDSRARFVAKGGSLDLWFTENGIRYDQRFARSAKSGQRHVVDMFFHGGNAIRPQGRAATGARSDYYTAGAPVLGVQSFQELYARNVVAGVDMRSYYDGKKPRYDLIVAPGANPKSIKLGFRGANGLSIEKGALRIATKLGGFANGKPFAYQTIKGKQTPVAVRWVVKDSKTATFALGSYDRSKALVIDPVVYGTYFGGDDGGDEVRAITANTVAGGNNGSVLITGATRAVGFPTSTGFFNYNNPTGVDAYVSRLQGDAYNRDYAVFVGGQGIDTGQYIKLDSEGNVWIAGTTTSAGFFSATSGTLPNSDIFVMRFTLQGNGFLTPTNQNPALFGSPTAADTLSGFDVRKNTPAAAGGITELAITGNTSSTVSGIASAFPVAGSNGNPAPDSSGYLLRVNYEGANDFVVDSSTSQYMVGDGGVTNETRGVVFDESGNLFVTGSAYGDGNQNTSPDPINGIPGDPTLFATTPGVFASTATTYDGGRLLRNSDLFARKYRPNGSLEYSGFIGGSGFDECGGIALSNAAGLGVGNDFGVVYTGSAIAIDALGNAYVTGVSRSFNFPRTNGVYGEVFDSTAKVIVTKINASGSAFIYSTNLGTSFGETAAGLAAIVPAGIAVDPQGSAFVTGNARARFIVFPDTPGDPNQPTSSELPSINIPVGLADVPDPLWESPTGAEFPTSEAFLMVLNPTATGLQFASYIGGILDDLAFAPYVDENGDVWTMGWTDGRRVYQRASSANPPAITRYNRAGSLPAALISNLALKSSIDTVSGGNLQYQFAYGALSTQPGPPGSQAPSFVNGAFARDGFIVKVRVNRPSVASITLNPATIPGGLGASSAGTVTLTQGAPSGGAQVTISLPDGTTNASLSATNPDLSSLTLDIPAGGTTATFTVFSKPVTVNTAVRVRATYTGTFRETTLQVIPWLVSLTLPQNTVVGGDPIPLRGTVTLAAPAPAGGVDITLTSSSPLARITNLPFTVPAGQTSASFEIESDGVDADLLVTIQASLLGVTRSASVTLVPAQLQSITLSPDTVAGGSTSVATVTLNGKAGDAAYDVTLTSSDPTVRFLRNGVELSSVTVSIPAQSSTIDPGVTITTQPASTSKSVTITGTHNATPGHPTISRSATLRVQAFTVTTLTLDPSTVDSGGISVGTITLSAAAPVGGARVYLTVSNAAYATLQSSSGATPPSDATGSYVTVASGSKTATFRVRARYVGVSRSVSVTAQQSPGQSRSATLTIRPIVYTVSFNNSTVIGSDSGTNAVTGTIRLTTAPVEALTFTVSSGNTTIVPNPSPTTVTIPAGSLTGTFTLRPRSVSTSTNVVVTVSFDGGSRTATLQVNPVGLLSIVPVQKTIRSGTGFLDLDVNFNGATADAATLTISFNLESAFVGPRSVTIPAGTTTYRLHYSTNRLNRSQNVTITASYKGTTATTTVTVTR